MGWRDLPLFLRPLPGNPSQASAAFKEGCKPCLSSPVSDGQHRGSSCGYQGRFTCPLSHQVLSKWPPICSAFQLLGLLRRVLAFFRAISHGRRATRRHPRSEKVFFKCELHVFPQIKINLVHDTKAGSNAQLSIFKKTNAMHPVTSVCSSSSTSTSLGLDWQKQESEQYKVCFRMQLGFDCLHLFKYKNGRHNKVQHLLMLIQISSSYLST
ncbi:hypothetical protein MUK42_17647 [Musa troglodytarum]|uniref:Uncharacterized protein n=1 Tax=Musa troglodytarum TaxID=320322 RepID=A0A9E7KRB2_9LILI|nr:hypothetical protein MUK42_17647 [Musa troglodytarum]